MADEDEQHGGLDEHEPAWLQHKDADDHDDDCAEWPSVPLHREGSGREHGDLQRGNADGCGCCKDHGAAERCIRSCRREDQLHGRGNAIYPEGV